MGTPFTISEICSKVMCSDLRNEKKGHCSSQDTMVNLLDGKKYYMHLWKIYIIKNTISQAIYFHSEKFKFRINLLNHKSIKSCEKKSNSEVPKVISQSPLHICTPSWTQEWPGSPCLAVSAVFPLHPQIPRCDLQTRSTSISGGATNKFSSSPGSADPDLALVGGGDPRFHKPCGNFHVCRSGLGSQGSTELCVQTHTSKPQTSAACRECLSWLFTLD